MTALMPAILKRRHTFDLKLFRLWVFQWQKRNGPLILCVLCLLLLTVLDESHFVFNPRQFRAIWYGEGNKARLKRGQRTDLRGGGPFFFPKIGRAVLYLSR